MSEPTKLRPIKRKVQADLIKYLERLTEEARRGELIGVTVVNEYAGEYRIDTVGACNSTTQVASMLIASALRRLGFEQN